MQTIENLSDLQSRHQHAIIFECVGGSRAYGTASAESDEDLRGIFAVPAHAYLSLSEPPKQVSDERGDVLYYSLRRFCELAADANPNILELLFMPGDCVRKSSPTMELLQEHRELFVTKETFSSHMRYAISQFKKARGQNKWINNPQPLEPPKHEDFCWFVPRQEEAGLAPYRPIRLSASGIDLSRCHAASLEHAPNTYRLYDYGDTAMGVIRGDQIVCESIPKEDESSYCIGLLLFDSKTYRIAADQHRHYWQWRETRNEKRWRTQEAGLIDYDTKNMMHLFRLLYSAEHILTHGSPLVRFSGGRLDFLRRVLNGVFSFEELENEMKQRVENLEAVYSTSKLPEEVDSQVLCKLIYEATRVYEEQN